MKSVAVLAVMTASLSFAVQLSEQTKAEFDAYIKKAEAQMDTPVYDRFPSIRERAKKGEIVAVPFAYRTEGKQASVNIRDGLVNHWLGVMFVPNVTVDALKGVLQNYGQYKSTYAPEVTESLVQKAGNDEFDIFLRLHRQVHIKALLGYGFPVEFNSNYHVRYYKTGETLQVRSFSTRIAEVKDPKKTHTEEHEVGNDSGYLWRLRSYWRLTPADGGVYVELEAVSLSRSVPGFVEKMVTYFTTNFPEDSMRHTLGATRKGAGR